MKKKIFAWALALMLVLQYFNYTGVLRQAEAAPGEGFEITGMQFGYQAESNQEGDLIAQIGKQLDDMGYELDYPEILPAFRVDPDKLNFVKYTWKLNEGHSFVGGQTYKFHLPEQLRLTNPVVNSSLGGAGTFSATTDGEVTVTFSENVNDGEEFVGYMRFWSYLDKTALNNETSFQFETKISEPITIHLAPKVSSSMTKTGSPNPDYNPASIDWTIDVNLDLLDLDNATVTDPIPGGLEYTADSLEIYKLNVNLDGTVIQEEGNIASQFTVTSASSNLVINLGKITDAYRIKFNTTITDFSPDNREFENTATLSASSANGEINRTASDEVSTVRGDLLHKTGTYSRANHTITWTIRYNFGEEKIDNAKIIDLFDNKYALGDVKVFEVANLSSAQKGAQLPNGYSVSEDLTELPEGINGTGKNGFILTFDDSINKAYIIEYTTEPAIFIDTDGDVNNTVYSQGQQYTSNAVRYLQKFYNKSHSVNYKDKVIDWTVTLNQDYYDITDVTFKDTLPSGTRLVENSLKVNKTSKDNTREAITPAVTTEGNGFTINLEPGEFKYVITYSTEYDYEPDNYEFLKSNYRNKGVVNWTYVETSDSKLKEFDSTFTPDHRVINNGYKQNGIYNPVTKEITWTIVANYNQKNLTNVLITDELQSTQNLLLSKINVYEAEVLPTGEVSKGDLLNLGTDYSSTSSTKKLEISFTTLDKPVVIEFTTSLDNEYINDAIVKNVASLSSNLDGEKNLNEATVPIPKAGEYIGKSFVKNPTNPYEIKWILNINFAQSTVEQAKVIDTPSNNLILKKDYILYNTTVAEDGTIEKNQNSIVSEEDYRIVDLPDGSFELQFLKTIKSPYVLEYTTVVDAEEGNVVPVSNTAKFEGLNFETRTLSEPISTSIDLSGADGDSINAPKGDLKVVKFDANNSNAATNKLAGAVFELYRESNYHPGAEPLSTKITDDSGEIVFDKLRYGKYVLKETQAPTNYVIVESEIPVIIDSDGVITIEVSNERETGDLEVTKVEQGNPSKLLPGAEFILYNNNKSAEIGRVTTGTDEADAATFGKAILDDLPFGTYVLKEVKAPAGYTIIGNGEQTIEIKPNEKTTVTVENRKFTYIPPIILPTPTPTPEPSEEPGETQEPGETNEPGETTSPTPTPTPGPSTTPAPTESAKPTTPPQKEKTTEETPVDGEVEVPENSEPKIGTPPSNGNVTITPDGKWTYVPNPGFVGTDRFSIVIINENGEEEEVWVDVEVDHVPRGGTDLTPDVDKLPKTGENSSLPLYLLGIALIGGGIALRFVKRNKKA